jgi:hypothetical protein
LASDDPRGPALHKTATHIRPRSARPLRRCFSESM